MKTLGRVFSTLTSKRRKMVAGGGDAAVGEAGPVLLTRENPREKGLYPIKEHFPLSGTSEWLLNSSYQWPEGDEGSLGIFQGNFRSLEFYGNPLPFKKVNNSSEVLKIPAAKTKHLSTMRCTLRSYPFTNFHSKCFPRCCFRDGQSTNGARPTPCLHLFEGL